MRILVVEDEYLQGDATCQALKKAFASAKIELLSTEHDFRTRLNDLAADPPRVVVMDIKLPWQELTPNRVKPPEQVRREGDRRAGFRCHRMLTDRAVFARTYIIFFSHILSDDLKEEIDQMKGRVSYLDKGINAARNETAYRPLVEKVRACLKDWK